VNAAGELISNSVRKDANIFFGMSVDESLGDEVKLTLIATGLDQDISNHKPSSIAQQQKEDGTASRKLKAPSLGLSGRWGWGKKS